MEVKVLSTDIPHKSIPSSYVRPDLDRSRLSEVSQIDNVPIIDLGCENRALIVEQIRHACSTFGFFQVPNLPRLPLCCRSWDVIGTILHECTRVHRFYTV
ncbi:unnamed protein product [Rhodiola kirilowii]